MIKILAPNLVNQIAAGEVIERPSSVIKELIENALDANSSEINISVKGMGLEEIIVSDNGDGISKLELPLILKRHATSKIYTYDDLAKLQTLGFRGEALPAIASISQMSIYSKTQAMLVGAAIDVDGGYIHREYSTHHAKGTTIKVQNLFYNTPARYKYLKSEQIERKNIIEVVKKMAISAPGVKFKLTIDDSDIITTYGENNMADLVTALYNYQASKTLMIKEQEIQNIKFKVVLFDPAFTRNNKNEIYLFCNNRAIQNYLLKEAVIEGYQSTLMVNRYPIAFVFITLDPYLIDANIHPQKLTIKLANEYLLKHLLTDLIKETINNNYLKFKAAPPSPFEYDIPSGQSLFAEENMPQEMSNNVIKHTNKLPEWDYLATFRDTYLLFTDGKALYLMDQHAACERINYERFFKQEIKLIATQPLLLPTEILLNSEEKSLIKKHSSFLKQYGFTFDEQFNLITVPLLEYKNDYEVILEYLLECLLLKETHDLSAVLNYQIKTKACKASIKAKQPLTPLEREKLLFDLNNCLNPYHCPHGRPVIVALDNYQIEKLFKRIV